jgi:hypothetical protein
MTVLVSLGFALLGCWCIGFAVREWRRREESTRADDPFFGGGRCSHRSNWLRIRGNTVAFGITGVVFIVVAAARLFVAK